MSEGPFVAMRPHAIEQYRKRRPHDSRSHGEISVWIRQEVLDALKSTRYADRKPKAFRLYKEMTKGALEHPLDRCVWNEDATLAWVIRDERSDKNRITVRTTLTRAKVKA